MIASTTAYVAAAFGLAGSLIGGLIAGSVSLRVARETRTAAEHAWVRDNRREIYDRFLTTAQSLLIACEESATGDHTGEGRASVPRAYADFFNAYGVVQTVAERAVVDAARVYAYRLLEVRNVLESRGIVGPDRLAEVAQLVRFARHDTIDVMRADLGLLDGARPRADFNPFEGTEFAEAWARGRDDSGSPAGRTSVGTPRPR